MKEFANVAARAVAWVVLIAAVWVMSTSLLFLWLGDLLGDPRIAPWQRPYVWFLYLPLAGRDLMETLYLILAPLPLPALAIAIMVRRRSFGPHLRLARSLFGPRALTLQRGVTDNHGHADWLPIAVARTLFPGPGPSGGIVVGEAYRVDQDRVAGMRFNPDDPRSWGQGGTAPLLIDPCTFGPTHSMIFSGSGGYKTTSAVTTIMHWTGSAVVLDPSCEVGPMLERARRAIGHKVHQLTLDDPDSGFNVLDWIDISVPLAETNVCSMVWWIAGGETAGASKAEVNANFFRSRGHSLIACLLADMLWDDTLPAEQKTLITLRAGLTTPEKDMRRLLQQIHQTSRSQMARDCAGTLMGLVAETFSGVYANADEDTKWLSNPAFARLVSGNRFRTQDILAGKTTIFLQIPIMALQHSPSVARVILGAMLNVAYEAKGRFKGRMLFLLDEVARLGTMRMLEDARDLGRKYRITLQLLYQSEGQLVKQWGEEGRREWFDSVSWRGYAALQDPRTAKDLCDSVFGDYAVLAMSEGNNSGSSGTGLALTSRSRSSNRNTHEIKRALIRPDELLADVRADELFVIPRGARALRCGRAIFFRRPEIAQLVDDNRFHDDRTAA
jgi:type IV secretion system protein VirD4